jgi:hypothetical protein
MSISRNTVRTVAPPLLALGLMAFLVRPVDAVPARPAPAVVQSVVVVPGR